MNNFGTLYGYELRKIFRKKIVWITAILIALTLVFSVFSDIIGTYYVDGVAVETHYNRYQTDKAYRQALDGKIINQNLLEEMKAGYDKIPADVEKYSISEEYNTYARPYSAIFNLVKNITGMYTAEAREWIANEADMYVRRQNYLEENWKENLLTEEEKDFWRRKESELKWPLTYTYCDGYDKLMSVHNTVGIVSLVAIAICLAGVFTEEYSRKTDQLILCSKYGKQTLYWAKLAAGVSFSVLLPLFYITVTFISTFALHGADGLTASFRILWAEYSYNLTVGEAIFIMYAIIVIACVVTGVFTMMLSEWTESNVGTLALVVGSIILTMFMDMPSQYRYLAQLWSYLPSEMVAVWSIFCDQTVSVFGKILTAWQIVPILYAIVAAVFVWLGRIAYGRYQVKGR